jgi:hypothetical protein
VQSKLVSFTLVALLSLVPLGFSNAVGIPDEQYLPPNSTQNDQTGIWFEDNIDMTRMPSILYSYKGQYVSSFCNALDDPVCANADRFNYVALLPKCENESSVDCIESLYAINSSTPVKIQGTLDYILPATVSKKFKGNISSGLPEGSNSGVWTLPGVLNKAGTDKYVVIVSRNGNLNKVGTNSFQSMGFGDFRAGIFPVSIIKDAAYKSNVANIRDQTSFGVEIQHPSQKEFRICAIIADGICASRQGFPVDTQFGLRVRLSKPMNGWVHGRIETPIIDYQTRNYGSLIDIQGYPTKVPMFDGWISQSSLTQSQKDELFGNGNAGRSGNQQNPFLYGEQSMKQLGAWAKFLGDKATAMPTQWIFHTLSDYEMQGANKCIIASTKLAGLVSTNSTTYSAGPPVFNKEDQTLDYKVASPHLDSNGEVFKGSYDLYIDENVARCIYGFSSAPVSATVSIVSSDGKAQVATTTLTTGSGWLHLSAKGFTFSNPTLKVKLTQKASAPIQEAVPIKATPKKITCVKGKVSKIVTSATCPTGYKKK